MYSEVNLTMVSNILKQELTYIYQPSEATVSSEQVKTPMWMLDSLQSALQLLHAEIDCYKRSKNRRQQELEARLA